MTWTLENDDTPYLFDDEKSPIAIVLEPSVEKLLVAAPLLLEALQELLEGTGNSPDAARRYAKARAAVAKATGAA